MFQPSFEMESGQNIYVTGNELALIESIEDSRSSQDLMTRRLKNRERQRRYRARKRLEADMKKACNATSTSNSTSIDNYNDVTADMATNQPIKALQVANLQQVNGVLCNFVTKIHCKRDWKKDARRANFVVNSDNEVKSNGSDLPDMMVAGGSENHMALVVLDDSEMRDRTTLSRRQWKAEARNKKN